MLGLSAANRKLFERFSALTASGFLAQALRALLGSLPPLFKGPQFLAGGFHIV